jgi:hypothetical protein
MNQRYPLSLGVPARLAVVALLAALLITGGLRATPAFAAAPTVTSLSPASGSTAGGYSVVITGTNFTASPLPTVTVGGTAVSVTYSSSTQLTIISMPPKAAGTVDVVVTTTDGTSANTAADDFTYLQAPVVSGLSPTSGLVAGGNTVTITGTGFTGANAVSFGGSIVSPTVNSDTTITVTAPAHVAGTVDVLVVHPTNGTSANTIADNYTYLGVPVVSSLSPSTGPIAGGNAVTITGLSLTGALVVTFGGTSTAFVVTGDTSITATAPAHAAGTVDVFVTTAQGTSANTAADDYTYGDLPVVTSLSPTTGPISGGTVVTITGTGFTGATSVTFGGTAAAITSVTATTITVTAPAHTAGTVDVLVTTPAGTSANTAADNFTYTSGPSVTSISPKGGPVEGGTLVTITGSGFTGATSVTFGGTSVTPTVLNDTTITAISPARPAGTVDVRVVTPLGTSPNTAADDFVYGGGPIITSISPTNGPQAGGNTVTITGTGFTGATSVTFGATSLTPTVSSDTSISVVAPAGTGTVDIRVVTPVGTSPNTAADNYTYGSVTTTFTLYFRWTLIVWTGANGASISAALSGQETPPNPATNDVSGIVTAIFKYNNAQQRFEGYFPGSANVPGANDFTTFTQGEAYWFAINSSSGASWTVLVN